MLFLSLQHQNAVDRGICKTWTGTLANSADRRQTSANCRPRSDAVECSLILVCIDCLNYRTLRVKWNSFKSSFSNISPAYTQRQSTQQCCQCFDLNNHYTYNHLTWHTLYSMQHQLNPSLAEHDMPCLSKQCRSRSVGLEANWSESALFVIKYVNIYQKHGSSNLIGLKLEVGMTSLFSMTRFKLK